MVESNGWVTAASSLVNPRLEASKSVKRNADLNLVGFAGAQQVMSALPPPNSSVGEGSGRGEGQAQGGGKGEGGMGHALLDNAPTDEDVEDFSVAECIQRAKACMEAAEGVEGEGEGGLRWRLAGEGMRSLGEVDEDSPAHVQALYAQLKALQV